MSTSSPSTSWTSYAILPPIAAVSIVPWYYAFAHKSAMQTGTPVPKMTIMQALKGGVKIAPSIGATVGTQLALQDKVDQTCRIYLAPLASTIVSSAIVGAASSPILAVFNGQTMGFSWLEALRNISPKQIVAITARETSFLGAMSICGPLTQEMKKKFGDNKTVTMLSSFTTGVGSGLFGQIPDAALSRWQKGLKVDATQLGKGLSGRCIGLGGFTATFQLAKEIFGKPGKE